MKPRALGTGIRWTRLLLCLCLGLLLGGELGAKPLTHPRFEVEVHTQGNDQGDKTEPHRSIKVELLSPTQLEKGAFEVPPWKGTAGTPLDTGSSSSGTRQGRHFHGCGPTIAPGQPDTSAEPFPFGVSSYVGDLKSPAGRYRVTSPMVAEVVLTKAQRHLEPTQITAVKGNDTTGYTVVWKPVTGAAGYRVTTYGGQTFWANSPQDWREVGTEAAVRQGILLRDTTCVVPGGMYGEPFRVCVEAISPDVRVEGEVLAIGYAHSEKTRVVTPSMGALPRPATAEVSPDRDLDLRPEDPFRAAIFDGDLERVAEMVRAQPDLVNQPSEVVTPLCLALMRKKRRITKFLIEHGADVNLADRAGQTPLFFTCGYEDEADMAELLLKHGAKVEKGNGSETPLHHAACFAEVEIIKVLLKHGANPNSKDSQGFTPLDYTKNFHRERSAEAATLLKAHGAQPSPPRPAPKPRPPHKQHRAYPAPTRETVFKALEDALSVELFSIDPLDMGEWETLGKVRVAGTEKEQLVKTLIRGVTDSDGTEAMCFNPRHAVVVRTPGKGYFLIICYECLQIYAFQFDPTEAYDSNGRYGKGLKMLTTAEPARLLNELLKRGKVPMPKH